MTNKFISSSLSVLCCFLLSTGSPEAASAEKPLKVGAIMALSGDAASIGEAVKNGMMLAYDELPPDKRERIDLQFEDDGLAAKNAVSAFTKLTSSNGVDVILNFSSGTAHAIAPLAESKKIPFVAIASDGRIVQGRKYSVLFWVTPDEEAKVTVPEALRRGYKRVARILTTQEGVIAARDAFDRFNSGRIAVVLDEEYPPDIKDFRPFIAKLRSRKDIDAVFPILLPGQCGTFAKQLRQAGITLPMFSIEMFGDSNEVKAAAGALDGAWYTNAADPSAEFLARYKKKYPNASTFGAANGHDFVLLLAAALDRDASREGINHFLHNVKDFSGALGTYSSSGDNRFTLPAAVMLVDAYDPQS